MTTWHDPGDGTLGDMKAAAAAPPYVESTVDSINIMLVGMAFRIQHLGHRVFTMGWRMWTQSGRRRACPMSLYCVECEATVELRG